MKQKVVQTKKQSSSNGSLKLGEVKNKKLKLEASPVVEKNSKNLKKQKNVAVKKPLPKKQKQVEEQDEDEENDSAVEETSDEEDSLENEEEVEVSQLANEDEDDEDDDDDDDDDDDEEEDEEDEVNEADDNAAEKEDDSDEEPEEAPITKKPKKEKTIKTTTETTHKINPGKPKKDTPPDQIIYVGNLPNKFKQIDIVEVFGKYGQINTINPRYNPNGQNTAIVVFDTAEAAKASLAADKTVKIKNNTITVSSKDEKLENRLQREKQIEEKRKEHFLAKDRTVHVRNIKFGPNIENDIRNHFAPAGGTIEDINVIKKSNTTYAFVVYKNEAEAANATKKLNNSVLNDQIIKVSNNPNNKRDPKTTIVLQNPDLLETVSSEKLEKIFSKYGTISDMDVLCKKNVLAFISFEEEKSAKAALKLSGTTVDGIALVLAEYKNEKPHKSIFILNVKQGTSEADIRELLEGTTGPIEQISLKRGSAVVHFPSSDGYCKSFLHNEDRLNGQMIFIEPYSIKKGHLLQANKRSHQKYNGRNDGSPAKKFKSK